MSYLCSSAVLAWCLISILLSVCEMSISKRAQKISISTYASSFAISRVDRIRFCSHTPPSISRKSLKLRTHRFSISYRLDADFVPVFFKLFEKDFQVVRRDFLVVRTDVCFMI